LPAISDPPRSARRIGREWVALSSVAHSAETFHPDQALHLPVRVGKWLGHTVAEGTPLARVAWFRMHGQIRIGSWRPFTATQVLAPGVGFIWAATARFGGIPVSGYDKYFDGVGEMSWRMAGLVPVMTAKSRDITTSAAGRLAAESALVPTGFARAQWSDRGSVAEAVWCIGDCREIVQLDIDDDGRLRGILMQRWGNPSGEAFGRYPFGIDFESETEFGGITIPTKVRAGWHWHTDKESEGEFFRATITDAVFR
jgi:uncharacterized protein DUF6920